MTQDFSNQSLRGRSFRDENLTNANFSHADIRGADFTKSILINANFSQAIAGIQGRWSVSLVAFSVFLSFISGGLSVIAGFSALSLLIETLFPDDDFFPGIKTSEMFPNFELFQVGIVIILISLFTIAIRQGMKSTLKAVALALFLALVCVLIFSGILIAAIYPNAITVMTENGTETWDLDLAFAKAWQTAEPGMKILIGIFALLGMAIFNVACSSVLALLASSILGVAVVIAETVAGEWAVGVVAATTGIIAFLWAIPGTGGIIILMGRAGIMPWTTVMTIIWGFALIGIVAILEAYISWQALQGDSKFIFIRKIAFSLAATGGTSFRNANLTDANFTRATLKSTDLRGATLLRTCWHNSHWLDRARLGKTYLQNRQIQKLVITGQGQNQNFDGQPQLEGINLQGANLKDASFIGANLYQANLQNADLSRAKLARSHLARANLTGAILTGACIENWGATSSTKLEGIVCEYIYMRLPSSGNPDPNRMPPQGTFQPGQFQLFIRSLLETFDLYHDRDINPTAAIVALRSLANEYLQSLQIVALEKQDKRILIKVKTFADTDSRKLQAEYFNRYRQLIEGKEAYLLPEDAILAEKLNKLLQKLKQGSRTVYLYNTGLILEATEVGMTIDRSRKINIKTGGGDIDVSGAGAFNAGDISNSTVANTINQLPESSETSKLMKEMLAQLQAAIQAEAVLSTEDKSDALEEVKVLAEAGKNYRDAGMQKMARKAIRLLQGTIAELPPSSRLVIECDRLLPAIAQQLSLQNK